MLQFLDPSDDSTAVATLIDDCKILPCVNKTLFPPTTDKTQGEDIVGMPYIDHLNTQECNCLHKLRTSVDLVVKHHSKESNDVCDIEKKTNRLAISSEDTGEVDKIVFQIKGSTYDLACQKNLKNCRRILAQDGQVRVNFSFEPDNIMDKNAIKVFHDANPLGYVPGERLLQIKTVMASNSIIATKLKVTRYVYEGKNIYQGMLSVMSTQKFPAIDKEYFYNKQL